MKFGHRFKLTAFQRQEALERLARGDNRAMKAGAIDFLTKPVDVETLVAAVARAQTLDVERRRARAEMQAARALVARLTTREREVLEHVVAGRLSKQIAADLGIVEKTIKVHRSRMMSKLRVRTIPDLMRLVQVAGITSSRSASLA